MSLNEDLTKIIDEHGWCQSTNVSGLGVASPPVLQPIVEVDMNVEEIPVPDRKLAHEIYPDCPSELKGQTVAGRILTDHGYDHVLVPPYLSKASFRNKSSGNVTHPKRQEEIDLSRALQEKYGNVVVGGPFQGMKLPEEVVNLRLGFVQLGSYEHELHPIINEIAPRRYDTLVNVGCCFGYYAVGLAVLNNGIKSVHTYDTDGGIIPVCGALMELNYAPDWPHPFYKTQTLFGGELWGSYTGKTLVWMDCEGAEVEYLNPHRYPALRYMDILVEMHDCFISGASDIILERFKDTHDIRVVENQDITLNLTDILPEWSRPVIQWEKRSGPTPWAWMKARAS